MPASTNVGPSKPRAIQPISDAASGGGYAAPPVKPSAPRPALTPNQAAAHAAAASNSSLQSYLSYLQTNMGRTAQDMIGQEVAGIQKGYLAQQKAGSQAIVGDTQTYVNELGKIGAQADQAYTTAENQQSALDTALGSALQSGDVGAAASKLTQALAAAGQNTAPGAAAQAAASQTGASQYASASAGLSQLFAQGAAQKAYDATLPGIAKAQGLGALGAFNASLTDAESKAVQSAQDKLPALMNAFTSQTKAQTAQAAEINKENQPKIYGSGSSGYFAILPNGKNVQLTAPGAPKPIVRSDGQGGLVQVDPATGSVKQLTGDRAPTVKAPPTKTVGGVLYQYNGQKWVKAAGTPKTGSASSTGKLSANEVQSYVRSLVKQPSAGQAARGVQPHFTTDYKTAYKYLRNQGVADASARAALNSVYPPGTAGRAWLPNEAQATLKKAGLQVSPGFWQGNKTLPYLTMNQYLALKQAGKLPAGHLKTVHDEKSLKDYSIYAITG